MSAAAFPLVEIAGSPLARGRAYGEAARERVAASVALYRGRLAAIGWSADDTTAAARNYLPRLEAFAPDLVEEMRGIAEGAAVALEDIVLVNARTEIVAEAARKVERDGCTGLVVLPSRSADGRLIHAQTWDWLAQCADTAIVLKIRRDDGPDILTFTEAGGLARSGFNAAGISVSANYLRSDRDFLQPGIPLPFIRRRILEQEHLALAIGQVIATPKAVSNNMMVAHRDGFAVDLECAPDEVFQILPEDGLIVHANHWISPIARTKLRDMGLAGDPDSLYRDWRVETLLKPKARIARDDVVAALTDRFGYPYAVARPPLAEHDGNLSATVALIVMDPEERRMDVAPMPALGLAFTRYALTP
ncbi:MAG: C45 family peptidase [Hyphomicrobiales bacterium]